MDSGFYVAAVPFHVALVTVALWVGMRAARRDRLDAPLGGWLVRLCADLLLLGAVAAVAAALCALFVSDPLFAGIRMLSQMLFGELVVLSGWMAAVHAYSGRPARALLPAALASTLVAVYWDAYHREPQELVVRHHTLERRHDGRTARHLRIVHLTDIQSEEVGAHEQLALEEALRQKPDLVVFTGDYAVNEQAAADLRRLLQRVHFTAPLGVYAVPGDVPDDGPAIFGGLGVTWLEDQHVRVTRPDGGSIVLVGLSTPMSRTTDPRALRRLIESAPAADLRIVLGHAPDFVAELAGHGSVDLALAGHTHGGQIVLPLFGPPLTLTRLPRRYAGDLNDYQGTPLHVSRGIGMERGTAPRVRFLCPPEVCVLDVTY